jgi:demethylphylloquinone reductase
VLLQVTLIDQSERFVFKPLLYDFVAGTAKAWEVAPYFQQLLAPYNINFLQARISKLHLKSARACTASHPKDSSKP